MTSAALLIKLIIEANAVLFLLLNWEQGKKGVDWVGEGGVTRLSMGKGYSPLAFCKSM